MGDITLQFAAQSIAFREIPAGDFLVGTEFSGVAAVVRSYPGVNADWIKKETPQRSVFLPTFYMMDRPVTNDLWKAFLNAWPGTPASGGSITLYGGTHPVSNVSPSDLAMLADRLAVVSQHYVFLPSELQWEKASRGVDGREYPWGDRFDPSRCNTREGGIGSTTPVDAFPRGRSPYGLWDMAGNVEEWTGDYYRPYPDGPSIVDDLGGPNDYRVSRGGSWDKGGDLARCARRHGLFRDDGWVGGRLALIPNHR